MSTILEALRELNKSASNKAASRRRIIEDANNSPFPEGITEIKGYQYEEDKSLVNITIPGTVARIGAQAFLNCPELKTVVIENGGQKLDIAEYAFSECAKLEKVTILCDINTIYPAAFNRCEKLSEVSLPKNTRYIMQNAFEDCTNLKALTYRGTKKDWSNTVNVSPDGIGIGDEKYDTFIVHCSDGDINIMPHDPDAPKGSNANWNMTRASGAKNRSEKETATSNTNSTDAADKMKNTNTRK